MKKSNTEEQIHARLRELSAEVRRMRHEFSDDQRRPSRVERLAGKIEKSRLKSKPPEEK
jgi:hypothetical protein